MSNKGNESKKRRILSIILKILKWLCIGIIVIISLLLIIRAIGKSKNGKTPEGGINESMYVDINHTKQWINIYGQNINNPVILYLHGGPGEATSPYDYVFLRKWSDVYTVVTWDQRNSGLSYSEDQNNTPLTHDLFMNDGLEMTKYLINYLHKDKISIIGHSWGTALGSNLVLSYPEYFSYYIGTGQLIDVQQNEEAFIKAAKEWTKGDKEGEKLLAKMDMNNTDINYFMTREEIMKRYGYNTMAESPDYNVLGAVFFNPNYSISDIFNVLSGKTSKKVYEDFLKSEELRKFSLIGKTEYKIPFYNILGDHDFQTNHVLAEDYFNSVKAPRKKLYIMNDMNHGLLETRSDEFSNLMHEIAKLEQNNSTITVN